MRKHDTNLKTFLQRQKTPRIVAFILALTTVIVTCRIYAFPLKLSEKESNVVEHTDIDDTVNNKIYFEEEDYSPFLEENISLRDKFTKHYTDPNGKRYAVIFPEQIHYQENGSWLEIDNTLELSSNGRYISNNEQFRTEFAARTSDNNLVVIEDGEYSLSWSVSFSSSSTSLLTAQNTSNVSSVAMPSENSMQISNVNAEIVQSEVSDDVKSIENIQDLGKASSEIRYNKVFDNKVDLRYSVLHGKVEEDIILTSPSNFGSYTLTVNMNGLSATKQTDNSVFFVAPDGERIFTLGAPWMKDSYVSVSDDIDVTVIQNGDTAYITYTPDPEFLNDASTVYPVLIDPSFTTRMYTSNYVDTYVYTGDAASSTRPSETTLKVGTLSGKTYYSYIKILNIPEIVGGISIDSATLRLITSSSSPALNIYQVNGAWNPNTITYSNRPSSSLVAGNKTGTSRGSLTIYDIDLSAWVSLVNYYLNGSVYYFDSSRWNGFQIGSASSSGLAQIYSSEYSKTGFRPYLTIEYTYYPYGGIEDEGVYSFVNSASGKYLTVHNGGTANGTNIYQYTKNNSFSQAFRLEYSSASNSFKIRAMSHNSGYGGACVDFMFSDTYSSSGYTYSNVRLYDSASSPTNNNEWVIYPYEYGYLYRIVARADPDLALTAYGTSNGTSGGTTSTSAGNVFVSKFTGAANQLWKIESGGVRLSGGENIKDAVSDGTTYTLSENADWLSFCCPVSVYGESVSWSSTDPYSVVVDSWGNVTAKTAGYAYVKATVTHNDGSTTVYSRPVYVALANGTYYFNNKSNNYRIEYKSLTDFGENSLLRAASRGSAEPTSRTQMFKVKYLGGGTYSIRSMLDSSMGWSYSGNYLSSESVGTSDNLVFSYEKWKLGTNANGYYIYNNYAGTSKTITAPTLNGDNIPLSTYQSTNTRQNWLINKVTSSYHGVTIRDKVVNLAVGDSVTFAAAVYSTYTDNGQDDITWSVTNGTGSATIHPSLGVLIGGSTGTVTVKVTYKPNSYTTLSDNYQLNIVPFKEGTYFVENKELDSKFMQIDDNVSSSTNGATLELWGIDAENHQKWTFDYVSGEYYKIVSVASGKVLTAPSAVDGSITQTSYTGASTQLWKITTAGDDIYRLSPKSNPSYYMSAGDSSSEDGVNIEMRSSRSDSKDEWYLYLSGTEAMLMGIYDEGHDHTTALAKIMSNLLTCGYESFNFIATDYISRSDVQNSLETSEIYVSRSHGGGYTNGTRISLADGIQSYLRSEDIYNFSTNTPVIDLSDCDLALFVACHTGANGDINLPNAAVKAGAKAAVGFKESIGCNSANEWTESFFIHYESGETVEESARLAALGFSDESGIGSYIVFSQ